MRLGMIGLGRMGSHMVRRLINGGHECVVYDVNPKAVQDLASHGAVGAGSSKELVSKLSMPRVVWLMVPAAVVDKELEALVPLLGEGDIVVDGGNSFYRDDIRRGAELKPRAIHYVDVGTNGGVAGLERGFCLMIGGEKEIVRHLSPIFAALAPGVGAAPRTPGRAGRVSDSGEGRWTVAVAVDEGVPVPVISAALFGRFESRGDSDYADRILSAMRKQFGGHDESPAE